MGFKFLFERKDFNDLMIYVNDCLLQMYKHLETLQQKYDTDDSPKREDEYDQVSQKPLSNYFFDEFTKSSDIQSQTVTTKAFMKEMLLKKSTIKVDPKRDETSNKGGDMMQQLPDSTLLDVDPRTHEVRSDNAHLQQGRVGMRADVHPVRNGSCTQLETPR